MSDHGAAHGPERRRRDRGRPRGARREGRSLGRGRTPQYPRGGSSPRSRLLLGGPGAPREARDRRPRDHRTSPPGSRSGRAVTPGGKRFVVDASVAIKWIVDEADSDRADLLQGTDMVAPALLRIEAGNVLRTIAGRRA